MMCDPESPSLALYRRTVQRNSGSTTPATIPKRLRRPNVASTPTGYKCINRLMNRAIGKVLTKARSRDRARDWGKANRQRQNATVKRWTERNRETSLYRSKQYNDAHKKEALEYQKQRRKTDEVFALKCRMRSRLLCWRKSSSAGRVCKTFDAIGCTPEQLRDHLRQQCTDFAVADYAVDHIFPLDAYKEKIDTMQHMAMHWSNVQPLTQAENSSKSSRLPTKAMAVKVERWAWPPGITEDMLPDKYDGWETPLRM